MVGIYAGGLGVILSDYFGGGQVLIFAEKKADVDAIHEYLLLKGVEAVAIHGGKGQDGYFTSIDLLPGLCAFPFPAPARPVFATPNIPTIVLTYSLPTLDQEERTKAIEAFREGKKDVLVATDVASKGLDFPAIQHVINYDMPEEIENYGREAGILMGWAG